MLCSCQQLGMDEMWNLKQYNGLSKTYFKISEKINGKIRAEFDINSKLEDAYVDELSEWSKKQCYLPKEVQDETFLRIFLFRSKYDVEKTKVKLEDYFKTIPNYSEYFVKMGKFRMTDETNATLSFPKLTPKYERPVLMRINPGCSAKFDIYRGVVMTITAACVALHRDYAAGQRIFIDFQEFGFRNFLSVTPWLAWKLLHMHEKIFSLRITGIDIINGPRFLDKILAIFKPFMKQKLYRRICIHNNLESLHEKIPPDCLPAEYGGTLGPIDNLIDNWDKILEDEKELFDTVASFANRT